MANYSALRELILEKEASILPEFLAKPSRDGFIDPRHDDFSKNQAFGRGVGVGLLPAALGAGVAVGGRRALGAGIAGAGALAGLGMYRHRLQQFRDLQAQGRNPVTGRMHDPERIERTRRYVERMRAGKRGAQEALNQQVLADLSPKTASYAEAKEAAASKDPRLARAGVSGYNQAKRTPGHPTKSHIVVAKEGDKVKTIRFGQQGVKTNQTAGQREAFKSRHRKNISRGRMSAAYWADKAKWSAKKTKDKDNPKWVKGS
jgi:hypothetical protein